MSKATVRQLETVLVLLSCSLIVAGAVFCVQPECFPSDDQRLVRSLLAALDRHQPEALELARTLLQRRPDDPYIKALAAESAAVAFAQDESLAYYRALPADGGQWELISELGLGRRLETKGNVSEAERHLRRVLELDPCHLEANSRLSHILQVSGRPWEAIPLFFIQMKRGKCRGDELLGVAAPERFFRSDDHLDIHDIGSEPVDVLAILSLARRHLHENRTEIAEGLLRQVVDTAPQLGEAQGRLGRLIYDRGNADEFLDWRSRLPTSAQKHPEVWYVQGLQARRIGQTEGAVRCFLEALTLSPNHLGACTQIASCLEQLKRADVAQQFANRALLLGNLEGQLNIARGNILPETLMKVRSTCAELGRFWEAAGWTYAMSHLEGMPPKLTHKELLFFLNLAFRDPHQTADVFNPVLKLRLTDFAEPHWGSSARTQEHTAISSDTMEGISWSFRDVAQEVGIDFQYDEGTTEETRLQHIFNVVGGGLAATDYDLDGWVDLYLAQANHWRRTEPQPNLMDRLYRNQSGEFQDVTTLARLGDTGFTHGVAAGDFDQDGFADLAIGNLGPNRLYRNNGDGTFADVTDLAGIAGNEWTTSGVLADFSGDGLPDLYFANYSEREATAKKECYHNDGKPMACTPDVLPAEFHRLYLNEADGTFRDVTVEAGMHQPNGRGLGLIAWQFGEDHRLGLFVGNDTSANFLFVNERTDASGIPQFREEASIRGVAFDADGKAQACMGIAASDLNGDGRLDMYITNFFGESDVMYSQRADGTFDDVTRPYNLRDSGFWTLGFGCQCADFDGDGWEDVISTNGHVDQQSRRGDPDRAPPQLFWNAGGRRFVDAPKEQLGPFFQGNYLGRGLARLDWNRDGKIDFAVSHLHDSLALVANESTQRRRPLRIRLSARNGAREAIGASVKVSDGKSNMTRLVTGGDGYLVTNERFLQFALSDSSPLKVEVRWPDGTMETWTDVSAGKEVLLIQHRPDSIPLHTFW